MAHSLKHHAAALLLLLAVLLLVPAPASAGCECGDEEAERDKPAALRLKYTAIAAILAASTLGIAIPVLGARFAALRPEGDAFFVIKAFAAGVILATAMIHILPEAMEKLASPCLPETPWQKFPFSGFVSMVAALATMVVDNVASSYYRRVHFGKARPVGDLEEEQAHAGHVHVHVHTHATHGHAHGALESSPEEETLRHRVVSQVLELGIVIHSVIIGIALGTSESPSTIRPLVAALSFHQFFEGIGLGGCLVQAGFKVKAVITMAIFFCLTTPIGIAIGIGIASSYDENSTKALIVEGILDSASSGILIYTSLVDLLAEDFSNSRMQTSGRLQLMSYTSLFLGAGMMSLIGKWA